VSRPRRAQYLVRFFVAVPRHIAAHAAPPPPPLAPARRRVAASEPTAPRIGQHCHRPVSPKIFAHDFHQANDFLSISPTNQWFSTKGSSQVFILSVMICYTSAIPTQNLERGSLGWGLVLEKLG
jgi:hypothetical protein